jgi:ubiquinone/menaquinone biosynthesis C-methylase UbiE
MNEKQGYPERIIPDDEASGIVALHLKRYEFAMRYINDKRVLDVACGVGYGTAHLAEQAKHVVGVDIDQIAIDYANSRYRSSDNVEFFCEDAGQLHFDDATFDAVCSFETIEHVPDVNRFLGEVRRVLKTDGVFLVSTPAAPITTQSPANPHHMQEWTPDDFRDLLRHYFKRVDLYSQMPRSTPSASLIRKFDVFKLRALVPLSIRKLVSSRIGVHTTGDLTLDDVLIVEGVHRSVSEIVAVCS